MLAVFEMGSLETAPTILDWVPLSFNFVEQLRDYLSLRAAVRCPADRRWGEVELREGVEIADNANLGTFGAAPDLSGAPREIDGYHQDDHESSQDPEFDESALECFGTNGLF
jgi:hypothetical protein